MNHCFLVFQPLFFDDLPLVFLVFQPLFFDDLPLVFWYFNPCFWGQNPRFSMIYHCFWEVYPSFLGGLSFVFDVFNP